MQPPVGTEVVVCWVVVGGGGGGGAACVVVVGGGGGGGAACVVVVVVGGGVLLGAVGTAVARALCAACLPFTCRLALCACFGFAFVVVVVGVDWVVEVLVVAATLWLEVDEEPPQALTINTSTMAANAVRRCLIGVLPGPPACGGLSARTPVAPGCFPDLNRR
jgi:hypothetical protein